MALRGTLALAAVAALGIPATAAFIEYRPQGTSNAAAEQEIYIVQPRSAQAAAEADGEIEADDVLQLSFEVDGMVKELYVNEGDTVQEGDVIAVLENEPERIDVATAQVDVDVARVQLEDVLTIDDNEIRLAEARVQSAMNTYAFTASQVTPQDIQAAELQYNAALDTVRASREARIRGGGGMLPEGVTLLDAQIGEAIFDAEIARLQLENLRDINNPQTGAAGERIQQAEAELARVLAGPTEFEIEEANLAVEAAEQDLRQAALAFERTFLFAPADGTVTDVRIELGQQVERNRTTMQLVTDSPLHATVDVDEIDFRQLEIGLPALVTLDALPGVTFPGTVSRIAPEGIEVGGVIVYETEVTFDEPDPRIRIGMSSTAFFGVRPEDNTLIVPERFIRDDAFVSVVQNDGTVEEVEITTGVTTPEGVEVLDGLSAGDAIVTDAQ